MQPEKHGKSILPALIGVLWCIAVSVAYYVFNVPYYTEKLTTFGRFFFG